MSEITLVLSIILGVGFTFAKLCQLLRLPSVTGYICAGLALGPGGLGLITEESLSQMGHFTQIALMLIAFGIGEHLEIKRIKHLARSVSTIGLMEGVSSFIFVATGFFITVTYIPALHAEWRTIDYLAFAMLVGAVSIATAPAATLHVIRELKAKGSLTTMLLAVIAVDNGLAIMLFGIILSAVQNMLGTGTASVIHLLGNSLIEIIISLFMGVLTGFIIDMISGRLKSRGEMLTIGLSLLLLCGETARLFNYSPLLAGIAAGFTIINRDYRDVRIFRILNTFEPPIYVLFFTLAGAHLNFKSLTVAGWLGCLYFLLRFAGKFIGARIGTNLAGAAETARKFLGYALVPQAGVAIGLIFLIQEDPTLAEFAQIITPVVLAAIIISEISGPVSVRHAVLNAGEAHHSGLQKETDDTDRHLETEGSAILHLVPWTWGELIPPDKYNGQVIFGASHSQTVTGLARMATILAHSYQAAPKAVRVLSAQQTASTINLSLSRKELFRKEMQEVQNLGYRLQTQVVKADDTATGILKAASTDETRLIILGYPFMRGDQHDFIRVIEHVAELAPCPVIVIRFSGILHTEKILVPVISIKELNSVRNIVRALAGVGQHKITILSIMPQDAAPDRLKLTRKRLREWCRLANLESITYCRSIATEAPQKTILAEAGSHDLLVMAATKNQGLKRLFLGSLADGVARQCPKPVLMIYEPAKTPS